VPCGGAEDPTLGKWVSKQRICKRTLDCGEPSQGMLVERAAKLAAHGFIWEGSTSHPDDTKWEAQLAQLAAYKAAHGDCKVPKDWAEDPRLSSWVNMQRTLKKKLDRDEPSGMTAERAARLTALGLVWNQNQAGWEAQLLRLVAYKAAHGDCNVPYGWAEDPTLGRWVSKQRICKRKLDRGEPSQGMLVERVAKLEALGFA
jgi:hypothetical protein